MRSLDDMNRVQFLRVLVNTEKERGFDAFVAIASSPVPITLPDGALRELARTWFEAHEAERTEAIASVESATALLKAATTRARRGLGRRMGREEPELARTIG